MGKYVDLHVPDDTIGIQALRRIAAQGPKWHQLGVILDDGAPVKAEFAWNDIETDGHKIGGMTTCVWSYRMKKNIGFALVSVTTRPGERVLVQRKYGPGRGQSAYCRFFV